MFNKKTMVLYCGGASSLAPNAPASPGAGGGVGVVVGGSGGGGVPPPPSESGPGGPALARRAAPPLWAPASLFPAEGPRSLLGSLGRLGCAGQTPRDAAADSAALPEGELDGCEPEEAEEAASAAEEEDSSGGIPSPCASLGSQQEEEEEEEEEEAAAKGKPTGQEEEEGRAAASAAAPLGAPGEDHLRRVTREVVGRYLREAAGGGGGDGGGPKFSLQGLLGRLGTPREEAEEAAGAARALETLRRVGDGILEKHQLAFQGMLRKMEIKKEEDLKTMSEVATEVFRDGIINWGRIVTLISFGAFVAKHLKSLNLESGINTLTEIITDVLVTDKREWLVSHNAWEGFVKFFHVEDIEGGIRSVLMTFAGVAGLGAGLAFMIR